MGRTLKLFVLMGVAAVVFVALAQEPEPITLEAPAGVRAPEYAKPLGAAVTVQPAREDEAYLRAFASTFTSLTPENEMKWEVVQPRRGDFDFRAADALVELAQDTGSRVRGHPLVWDQQLPAWVADGRLSARELEDVLRTHIRTVVGRYRGRVAVWDVVNEPFEEDGSWTPSVWHRTLGERYVDIAFRAAREADPEARLFLNEIAAEGVGPKARAVRRLARDLQRRGVPIDGIGLQNHTTVAGHPRRNRLDALMRQYAELGLDVEITEMDVSGGPAAEQVPAYRAAAEACAAARNCTGLTVWGVTDRWSWLGPDKRPLLFDAQGRPKPALEVVQAALR